MSAWRSDQPYNDLPLLPPVIELETRTVLKQCIAARTALAELKQAVELIPNQGVLINALPLLEAQASSEIENIVTTTDRLFQFQSANEYADPATRKALRTAALCSKDSRPCSSIRSTLVLRNKYARASRARTCKCGVYREQR